MTLISLIVTQKTETNLTCLSVVFQNLHIPYLNRLETMGISGLHTRANAGLTLIKILNIQIQILKTDLHTFPEQV